VVELRPEMAGRVTGIYFEEGSQVPQGKLLLKINDSEMQAQLKKLEAQEYLAGEEEFRKRKLLEIKAISKEEYDTALNQLKIVQAEKQLLQAQIAKSEIHAPFGGKIGLRTVSPGSYISASSVIATLQQLDPVKVEFTITEKYSLLVKEGMEVTFTLESSDIEFQGRIYARESSVDPGTRSMKVRARASNRGQLLLPGKFARVRLVLERYSEALTIPAEALVTELTSKSVFLFKNGKAKMTGVQTNVRTPTEIQITEGLNPGDTLIVTGLLQITDGTAVEAKTITE